MKLLPQVCSKKYVVMHPYREIEPIPPPQGWRVTRWQKWWVRRTERTLVRCACHKRFYRRERLELVGSKYYCSGWSVLLDRVNKLMAQSKKLRRFCLKTV